MTQLPSYADLVLEYHAKRIEIRTVRQRFPRGGQDHREWDYWCRMERARLHEHLVAIDNALNETDH